jgi:hypothetical protein
MSTDDPALTDEEKAAALKFWVMRCYSEPGFVEAYDRLNGTNLAGKGTDLERMIDQACGRTEHEFNGFIEFCLDVGSRIPRDAWT